MNKRYRVIFWGLIESKDQFRYGMSRLGVSPGIIEQIIDKAPVILKEDMTLGYARQYADAIQHAGGRVNIQVYGLFEDKKDTRGSFNIEPLENFTMCPECGHKQLKAEACLKCGFVYKNEKRS